MHDGLLLSVNIIYEDNHLLAVSKPAGLPTMGVPAGRASLIDECKRYVKEKYRKPGNVYLGIVSRLDAPVTGVVLLARTSKAAARLNDQFRIGEVEKVYWALVDGVPDPPCGQCRDWVRHDERHRRMHIASQTHAEAKEARLGYRVLEELGSNALVEVLLETGRKHQIRVQLSHHGWPVRGDRKYGSKSAFSSGIALHARRIAFQHPVREERMEFAAPLPKSWPGRLSGS